MKTLSPPTQLAAESMLDDHAVSFKGASASRTSSGNRQTETGGVYQDGWVHGRYGPGRLGGDGVRFRVVGMYGM